MFVFFSFSSSKLIPYILPVFFPAAIVVGRYISYTIKNEKSYKIEAWAYTFISWGLAYGIPYFLQLRNDPNLYHALLPYLNILKPLLCTGSVLFLLLSYSKFSKWGFLVILLTQISFLYIINVVGPFLQKTSMKPFVEYIQKYQSSDTEVVVYGFYPQDLPFYLNRTVKIINWSGELDFGKKISPSNTTFLTDSGFKNFWAQKRNVCVIAQTSRAVAIPFPYQKEQPSFSHEDYTLICKRNP